jgi:hypothetical protein
MRMGSTRSAESDQARVKRIADLAKSVGQVMVRQGKALALTSSNVSVEGALQSLREEIAKLSEMVRDVDLVLPSISSAAGRELGEFETVLREGCASRGWRCDGQWPKFVIAAGVDLEVLEKSRSIRVGRAKLSGIDSKAVFTELERVVRTLVPINFDEAVFLEQLWLAYQSARGVGGPVPILRVYRQFVVARQKGAFWNDVEAKSFVEVSASQFRAQLSALLGSGRLTTKSGDGLRLFPPLDPKDAIFIFLPAEGRFGFIGRIEFSPER